MRKKLILPALLVAGFFSLMLPGAHNPVMGQEAAKVFASKIRIVSDGGQAVITLYDTSASRDFISMLPLSLSFRDYVGEEKIANLPRRLATQGGISGSDVEGDFAYYAPWGNLAVFYKGFGKGTGLHILGRIESGKKWLAGQTADFTARIELIE